VKLERRAEHRKLGRIDDERRGDGAAQALHRVADVGNLVAPDEGGAEVERVRALAALVPRQLDDAVPLTLFLELAEALRAVGVAAFADRKIGVLLAQRHLREER